MLVLPSSTEVFARREAGGKGFNLYLMQRNALPVPPWVVLSGRLFRDFISTSGIAEKIQTILGDFIGQKKSAADAETLIAQLFAQVSMPAQMQAQIADAYARLGNNPVISVRSSAADEDSAQHSFAGQLSSELYVQNIQDVIDSVKRCWASGFSERGLVYRKENNLPLDGITVAVVLQEMVDPDISGVLFTCDPVENKTDVFVVSAVYGVGEGLVSGALEADTYWLDAESGAETKRELAKKTEAYRAAPKGGVSAVPIDAALQEQACLSADDLGALHEMGRKLLTFYKRAQDVEWAIKDGKLYVLQTRPVTTLSANTTGFPNLWDNSNIVESYGGLTSPLSFSFALHNYRSVYTQFCEILGVPSEVVKDMDHYLRNMLGNINGRVFYNLYNWYKLVGVLPGFSKNREFMETMMGVREALSGEIEERVRPHPSWDTFRGKLRRVRTGYVFLYYHFTIQKVVDAFLTTFHERYERYRRLPFSQMSSDELFALYVEMDRVFIANWKAPIINDFLCMVHFGLLKKLTGAWLAEVDENLQNDLLAADGNLESAEPTKELIRLAGEVESNPSLRNLVENHPPADLLEVLCQAQEHRSFYDKVNLYIDRFGFRCMSEMKLEETDLFSDASYLFVCLKNYLRSGTTDLASYEEREQALRQRAEKTMRAHLKGPRLLAYSWSLKHARKAVRNRENTRFSRTRIYGVMRTLIQSMGADLCARGVLKSPRDIFFLTLEEIYGIHQGTLPSTNLQGIIEVRQKDYVSFEDAEPKVRLLTRGPVYWENEIEDVPAPPELEEGADYDLRGLPCCPGVVEGVVKVVRSAQDDLELNGEILVTPRTDPGWVPLYPSVSGLLVERGSLLSHSAIVAREMGLPAVVGIQGLMMTLQTGMRVRIDGKLGTVTILSEAAQKHAS